MEITPQIWLSIGLIVYYACYQAYDDFKRSSTKTNSNNRILESLRTKYNVTIRIFHAKKPYAFASFRAIWINEILFKSEKALVFAFYHEYYHLKNNHKAWSLFMRFIISLIPLTKYFVNWFIVIVICLLAAFLMDKINNEEKGIFEKKANDYARKMTSNDSNKTEA